VAERRVALIGFGLAGSVFHGPLIEAVPGLTLATVVTSNEERAARARDEYPGAAVVGTTDELWERASDHGLVVVATRNDSHVPLAAQALELNLPVVVDKPLAIRVDEARGLIEQAESRGLPLTVFQNRRWDSDQLTLRRLLDEGVLGEVHRYESRFERWRPELSADSWREQTPPSEGGGLLLDLGPHLVDQALTLFGAAAEVHGEVASVRGGASDDDVFIAITHRSGVRSHLWASSVAAAPGPRLRVLGSDAAFSIEGLDGQEDALAEGGRPGGGDWGAEPQERWGRVVRGEDAEPVRSENGAWPRFYELLAAHLAGDGPLPVDPRDAVATLEILERARNGGN
jgi:scyllo-inositol 2-dehydrogenase (NADP+)